MNEVAKCVGALALVMLGLVLASLCGPPDVRPEVVRQAVEPLSLRPLESAATGLPLFAGARGRSAAPAGGEASLLGFETVGPFAAKQATPATEPHWLSPTSVEGESPPLPVEMDFSATPLVATPSTASLGRQPRDDSWLLEPPAIPPTYAAAPAGDDSVSMGDTAAAQDVAWWIGETPPKEPVSSTVTAVPTVSNVGKLVPITPTEQAAFVQAVTPRIGKLGGPIVLDEPATGASAAPVAKSREDKLAAPSPPAVQPVAQASRTHVIADGDTLARLAERYLNDARRARDIFELNRDVLQLPELLPIGASLRIPAAVNPKGPDHGQSAAEVGSRLVPVSEIHLEPHPQAALQPPAPLAARGR